MNSPIGAQLIVSVCVLSIALSACHRTAELAVENLTGLTIDAMFVPVGHPTSQADQSAREVRAHYEGLAIGDVDGFDIDGYSRILNFGGEVEAGSNATTPIFVDVADDLMIVARDSYSRQLVYKRVFPRQELIDADWKVNIVDMR